MPCNNLLCWKLIGLISEAYDQRLLDDSLRWKIYRGWKQIIGQSQISKEVIVGNGCHLDQHGRGKWGTGVLWEVN